MVSYVFQTDRSCPEGAHFACAENNTGLCISDENVCNGQDDCHDGADEGDICGL